MSARHGESFERGRRPMDERAMTPVTAMAVLLAVVVLVGAVGYFVLSSTSHATTTASKSCSTSNDSQCSDQGVATGVTSEHLTGGNARVLE